MRRIVDRVVGRIETFMLMHVTPRRTGVVAVVAAVAGLATWISVATSGSTLATGVMSLREPPPERQLANEARGSRKRSPPARGDVGVRERGGATRGEQPQSPSAAGEPVILEEDVPAGELEPGNAAGTDRSSETAGRGSVATDRIVFSFGPPAVGAAPGAAAPPDSAAAPVEADRSPGVPGRAPTVRDAMAALSDRQSALEDCLDEASRGDDRAWLGRRVRLVVTFEPNGRVSSADLDDDEIAETKLAACLRSVARGISVAEFQGKPVSVVVPLRLGGAR